MSTPAPAVWFFFISTIGNSRVRRFPAVRVRVYTRIRLLLQWLFFLGAE